MGKFNAFIKTNKLKKALDGYGESLSKGDKVLMFNNEYEVMSPQGAKLTVLKDCKSLLISLPADKLKFLLKKGEIKKLVKSNGGGKTSITPQGFIAKQKSSKGQAETSVGRGRVAPLGTVRGGMMKVSMNPPKWIHTQTGHSYEHHSGKTPHGDLHHHDDITQAHRFHRTIMLNTHPDHHEELKKMVNEWHGLRRRYKNLIQIRREITQGGRPMPKWLNEKANKLNEDATKKWQKFEASYKEAVKKEKNQE